MAGPVAVAREVEYVPSTARVKRPCRGGCWLCGARWVDKMTRVLLLTFTRRGAVGMYLRSPFLFGIQCVFDTFFLSQLPNPTIPSESAQLNRS